MNDDSVIKSISEAYRSMHEARRRRSSSVSPAQKENNDKFSNYVKKTIPQAIKWDSEPNTSKEGASTYIIGKVNGTEVSFQFSHPDKRDGNGWYFDLLEVGRGIDSESMFNETGNKIFDRLIKARLKSTEFDKMIKEGLLDKNMAELDKAISYVFNMAN